MNVFVSINTTGPSFAEHEVIQLGMTLFSNDWAEELMPYGGYLRPNRLEASQEAYLRAIGAHSIEEAVARARFWEKPEIIWAGFKRAVLRNGAEKNLKKALRKSVLFLWDASRELPFLEKAVFGGEPWPGMVISMQTLAVSDALKEAYGGKEMVRPTFSSYITALGVHLKKPSDALERARALAKAYRKGLIAKPARVSEVKELRSQKLPVVRYASRI